MLENSLFRDTLWTWPLVGVTKTHLPGVQYRTAEMMQGLESDLTCLSLHDHRCVAERVCDCFLPQSGTRGVRMGQLLCRNKQLSNLSVSRPWYMSWRATGGAAHLILTLGPGLMGGRHLEVASCCGRREWSVTHRFLSFHPEWHVPPLFPFHWPEQSCGAPCLLENQYTYDSTWKMRTI